MVANKKVTIGTTEFPSQLLTSIVQKAIGDEALIALFEKYKLSKSATGGPRASVPPTDLQYKLAELRKTMTARDIAKQENVNQFEVLKAVHKVAMWKFLNA